MRKLVCIALFFSIVSCVNKDAIPSGIINKDSMQVILWDMMQADQFAKQYLVKDSLKINVKTETIKLYEAVFNIHHITKDAFQKSYQFYLSRPDLTKIMFDSLSVYATRQRAELYKPKQFIPKPAIPKQPVKPAGNK